MAISSNPKQIKPTTIGSGYSNLIRAKLTSSIPPHTNTKLLNLILLHNYNTAQWIERENEMPALQTNLVVTSVLVRFDAISNTNLFYCT